jgi:iron(III) transport system permease protein
VTTSLLGSLRDTAAAAGRSERARQPALIQLIRTPVLRSAVVISLLGLFTVVPVAFVLVGSFNNAGIGHPPEWGVTPWTDAFSSASTLRAIGYSVLLTLRVPAGVVIGLLIAWLLVRVELPGRGVIEFSFWTAFFLPALPMAVGWSLLLDDKVGLVNQALRSLPFVSGPVFDIHSVLGIIWVHMTLSTVPIMVMILAPALRQLDGSLEEAARMCGCGTITVLRTIVLPILWPVILTATVLGLIRGLEAFEIEQFLGVPGGIFVYSTRIYALINVDPPRLPQAMALSTLFLVALLGLALLYQKLTRNTTYATIQGRGMRFARLQVGGWRYMLSGALFACIVLALLVPLCMLVLGTFMRLYGFFTVSQPFTMDAWNRVLTDNAFLGALKNSLILALTVSILGLVFYSLLAYLLARSQLPGRGIIGLLVWLPWAVPGVLLGVALLWLMLYTPVLNQFYGGFPPLVLALLVQSMPFGVQLLRVSVGQISRQLEEAAHVSGANWLQTYARVVLPLLAPVLVTVGLMTFAGVIRDISTTVLLAGATTRPLALLMLEYSSSGSLAGASVIGVILAIVAVVAAFFARRLGLALGWQGA